MRDWYGRQPRVVKLALEFMEFARIVGLRIARVQEPDWRQLEDAAASLLANLGEAFDEESAGDRERFLRYAKRSAGECERTLLGGARLKAVTGAELDRGMKLLKDIKWDVLRLIGWTRTHRR